MWYCSAQTRHSRDERFCDDDEEMSVTMARASKLAHCTKTEWHCCIRSHDGGTVNRSRHESSATSDGERVASAAVSRSETPRQSQRCALHTAKSAHAAVADSARMADAVAAVSFRDSISPQVGVTRDPAANTKEGRLCDAGPTISTTTNQTVAVLVSTRCI